MVNNERNVHRQNINKECTWTEHYKGTSVTKSISLQLYTKPVYCTSVHKTSLLVNNERNVHGQNITKAQQLYTKPLYYTLHKCTQNQFSKLVLCTLVQSIGFVYTSNSLTLVIFSFGDTQTDNHTNICPSRAASSQLKIFLPETLGKVALIQYKFCALTKAPSLYTKAP